MSSYFKAITSFFLFLTILAFRNSVPYAAEPFFEQKDIYFSGMDTYHTYRIPAVVVSKKGTVLAFCEGRKEGISDHGNIHIVLKRSFDNGSIWEKMQVVFKEEVTGEKVTIGNPCPVVDSETGIIWLAFCRNNLSVFFIKSEDDGATWSKPKEISDDVTRPDWGWIATGPGNGIQLRNGRLIIPCDHFAGEHPRREKPFYSHIFFSDDHGETWRLGGIAGDRNNECAVVELTDGTLLLNMRNWAYDPNIRGGFRQISRSGDGGMTWSKVYNDRSLPEPECQASLIRFTDENRHDRNRVLFSNPASTEERIRMTVRLSYDECEKWPVSKLLHSGPSSYSSLAVARDGTILCLYEGGVMHRREWLRLARFNLEWLSDGKDSIKK